MSASVGYPPPRHLLRSLCLEVEHRPDLTSTARMAAAPHLLGPDGAVEPGAIATLVDATGGGLAALAAHPGWIATADLTLHLLAPVRADTVVATGRVVRRGRTTVVLAVDLAGPDGAPLGTATMSFAVLERRDDNPIMVPPDEPVRSTFAPTDGQPPEPLLTALGVEVLDAASGAVAAPMTPFVVNTLGAMQGGAVAGLAAVSATAAATARLGGPCACVDLELNYLALGREGPIRTRADIVRAAPDWVIVEVEVRDEGPGARLMTVARAVVVRP